MGSHRCKMNMMTVYFYHVLLSFVSLASGKSFSPAVHDELVNTLLKDYNAYTVPMNSSSHTIDVAVGFAIISIDDINDIGVMTATAWLQLIWTDFRLQWDEEKFEGLDVFRIDARKIWIPDIEVYNSAEPSEMNLASQFATGNAVVYPNGEVLFIPPVKLKVYCSEFDREVWPQGEQKCNIKIGSWAYDGYILNLDIYNEQEEMDTQDMMPSSAWKITHQEQNPKNEKYYSCCDEPYIDLNYRFKVSPTHPKPNPDYTNKLLHQLLVMSILILLMLIIGICGLLCLHIRSIKRQQKRHAESCIYL